MAATAPTLGDDWKDKYVKALNAFDEQDRQRQEQTARLARDLLAMLERGRGRHEQYDRALDRVAEVMRGSSGDLTDVLRGALAAYERFAAEDDPLATASAGGQDAAGTVLARLVAALQTDFGPHDGLDALQAALAAQVTNVNDAIVACVGHLREILDDNAGDGLTQARDTLQSLLDQLSLPEAVQAELGALTPRLQQAGDAEELRAVARAVANVVLAYVASLQGEIAGLGGFLRAVKVRLDEFWRHIGSERADQERAAQAREALDLSMRRSLTDMQRRVDTAQDIDTLKCDIQTLIGSIDANLDGYLAGESYHAASAGTALADLEAKVATLKRESEQLRGKLAEARASASRDTLTNLPNRLAYNDRIAVELARIRRSERPLSLAVIDLDHFKIINDTWGHQAGDRVLKHLAREISNQVRTQDFFARLGGEEFILLLPDTNLDGAIHICNALRRHVAECRFKYQRTPVEVTVSCGVTECIAGEAEGRAFARADSGLYAAKRNGRNRVEAVRP